ncbi:MAG: hypothetical protein ACRDFX_00925 [Chloroflexota bacterium]
MRNAILAASLAISVWLASAAGVTASRSWHVVKRSSASGQFAVTAINATITRPHAIGVKFIGHVQTGDAVVACSKGFSISSNSRTYSHAGFHRLPMTRGADSCDVTASVGGSGKVTVQILKQ